MDSVSEITRQELNRLRQQVERINARHRLQLRVSLTVIAALAVLWGGSAFSEPGSPLTTVFADLYQFSPNTPALAAEVNSNFATIRQIAGDNAARIDTKLDKSGGAVNGNLDVNGVLEVGTSGSTAIRMFNDSAIVGVDVIQGFNDVRLRGDASGGDDLVITAGGVVNVKHDLQVDGAIRFTRGGCHLVTSSGTWNLCPDGEFVAGVDHDNNNDHYGGVYCCTL